MKIIVIIVSIVTILIYGVTRVVTRVGYKKGGDVEKITAYECGLNPYGDAREPVDIQFYIVGLMFLIFDIEIAFLFPIGTSIGVISVEEMSVIGLFMAVLIVGVKYEWDKKALE